MSSKNFTLDEALSRIEALESKSVKSAFKQEVVWTGNQSRGTLDLSKSIASCDLIEFVFSYYSNAPIQCAFIQPDILREFGSWRFTSRGGENSDRDYDGRIARNSDTQLNINASNRLTLRRVILLTFGGGVINFIHSLIGRWS